MGLFMKKIALIACSLLLVGCAGPSAEESSETASEPTATSTTRAALEVSDAATCQTLIGSDGGLVSESGQFLIDVDELSDATAEDAAALADALEGVAATSSEQFRSLLTVMQEPFRDLVTAHEEGDQFSLDASRFKASGNEVIALCEPLMEASSADADADVVGKVPLVDTCLALFGSNQVAIDAQEFLSNVKSLDAETAREASLIHGRLEEVALTARPELVDPIRDLQVIFQDFIQGWEDSSDWSLDTEGFDAVVAEIGPLCSAELEAADESKPTSAPRETSGGLTFASEFVAAGIQPGVIGDSIEEHGAYAAERLCNPEMTDTSVNFQKTVEVFTGQGLSEEEAKSVGKGAEFVRLVVKYNCPDRSKSVESFLP
jgi:hypothetical protein